MARDRVSRAQKRRQAGRDEFLVPTGQSTVAKQRLQKAGISDLLAGIAAELLRRRVGKDDLLLLIHKNRRRRGLRQYLELRFVSGRRVLQRPEQ